MIPMHAPLVTDKVPVLHGETEGGNEGYLLMYNPLLEPYKSPKIDVVDVAPTLAKYLGADIPFATVGMPRRQFHNGDIFFPFPARHRTVLTRKQTRKVLWNKATS